MSVKQDLLLAFVECVDRNGARLARNRFQVIAGPLPPGSPSHPCVCNKSADSQSCVQVPRQQVFLHDLDSGHVY